MVVPSPLDTPGALNGEARGGWNVVAMERAMPRHGRYPDSLREEAIRLVREHGDEFRSQWEAICVVADQLGPSAETIRGWIRRDELEHEAGNGRETVRSASATTQRIEELEREVRELRRANEILKAAFAIFARDLDVEASPG
jgi:transposase